MASTDAPSRLLPLAEELLDNRYARDNLREGAEKLRDAFGRARKRRVKPSRDRKLRAPVRGRDHGARRGHGGARERPQEAEANRPQGHADGSAVIGVAAAAALALNEDLRESVLGSAKALGEEVTSGPASDSGSAAGSES